MPLISYREALNDAMREEMQRDSNIFILGEDVGFYGGAFKITEGLFAEFGEKRVVDTPVKEIAQKIKKRLDTYELSVYILIIKIWF